MAQGLCNAVSTFQRLMENVLRGLLQDFVHVYLDDILVTSENFNQHIEHLRQIFIRIQSANLRIKPEKCRFGTKRAEFLGHIITDKGIMMHEAKLEAIKQLPYPHTKKQLQAALGLLSYYRKFYHNFSNYAHPLYQYLTKEYTTKNFELTAEDRKNYDALKKSLIANAILAFPDFQAATNDPKRRLTIFTDASKTGLGAVLTQPDENGVFRPIFFASRRLLSAETRYPITELEALGVSFAANKFGPFIIGIPTIVYTDHSALIPMYKSLTASESDRVDKWFLKHKSKFELILIYLRGK